MCGICFCLKVGTALAFFKMGRSTLTADLQGLGDCVVGMQPGGMGGALQSEEHHPHAHPLCLWVAVSFTY